MAAAMDVVTSDTEEQIFDPRTLAALKYNDAIEAMKSADQLMAASQPTPTPPTVVERKKLAAEEGLRGLAQRLSPGMQQQGRNMAAQQRPMGGLPTQAAPNMARMAMGGIVGYAPGGPIPNSAPTVDPMEAQRMADARRYMAAQTIMNSPQATPQAKAQAQAEIESIKAQAGMDEYANIMQKVDALRTGSGGMARGGIIGYAPTAPMVLTPEVLASIQARGVADPRAVAQKEEARIAAGAKAAYAVPPELKALYDQRAKDSDEYYAAQLDPKRLRDQKINALLRGLSSSNMISRSGIAALEGTTAVGDNAMETRRQQSEGRFANLKEQEGINRENRAAAFDASNRAGQSAYERASAGVIQALQSMSQLAISEETAALEMVYKEYDRSMGILSSQLSAYTNREKLAADEQNVARQLISSGEDTISRTLNTMADLQAQFIVTVDADVKAALSALIQSLKDRNVDMQSRVNQLLLKLGVTPGQPAPTGSGGDQELESLLQQYSN